MSELQFRCSRIEDLAVAEQCTLLLSRERLVVILQGEQTLRCHPIDEFESCCIAKTSLLANDGCLVYLRTCDAEADLVIGVASHADANEICSTLQSMRHDRASRITSQSIINGSQSKFIWYRYYPRSVDHLLSHVVKWERNASPKEILPFPHGRLDMLRLHLNRSVMTKLSSHGDTRIEFSCDAVAVSLLDHNPNNNNSPPQGSTSVGPTTMFPRTAADAVGMMHRGHMHQNLVLILTDSALYLTKSSGSVVARLVRSSLADQTLSDSLEPSVDGRQFLLLKIGDSQYAVFQSKYAVDLGNTLHANRASSNGREPSIVRCGVTMDTAMQTETSLSELVVHPELSVLKGTVDLLQRQCSEKEVTIKLLQRQLDAANQSRPLNKKGLKERLVEENDILRHYVAVLEQSIDTFEEMKVRQALQISEQVNEGGTDSVVSLRQALAQALRREEQLQARLQSATEELSQVSAATAKALAEVGESSANAVSEFLGKSEKALLEQQLEMLVQSVLRVSAEQSTRFVDQASLKHVAELKANNEALMEEVQRRDRLLTEVLQRAEAKGLPSNSAERWNLLPRCDDVLERRERLLETVSLLEQQSSLIRAATEQAARSMCREVWSQSLEKRKLEQQVQFLSQLSSVGAQVSRLSDLESMVLDGIRRRSDSAVAAKATRTIEKELASVRCQLTTAQQTIKRLKHAAANPPTAPTTVTAPEHPQQRRAGSLGAQRSQGLTSRAASQANIPSSTSLLGKSSLTDQSLLVATAPTPAPAPPNHSISPPAGAVVETPTRQLMSPGAHHVSLQKELENQRLVFEQRLRDLEMVAFRGASLDNSISSRSPSQQMGIVQPQSSFDSRRVLAASTLHSHPSVLGNSATARARSAERSYYY